MYTEWKKIEFPKKVLYMNLGTTRLRGIPRNRWQDEVREDGRIVGGEGWQVNIHNREEWRKLLRTARNRHILCMPMEWMNEFTCSITLSNIVTPLLVDCYCGPVSLMSDCYWLLFLWKLNRLKYKAVHPPPSNIDIKNKWDFTATLLSCLKTCNYFNQH